MQTHGYLQRRGAQRRADARPHLDGVQVDGAAQLEDDVHGRPADGIGNEAGRVLECGRFGDQILDAVTVGGGGAAVDGRSHARMQEIGHHFWAEKVARAVSSIDVWTMQKYVNKRVFTRPSIGEQQKPLT